MSANTLLAQLEGVKQTGAGRWLARCPAHDDRRASLAIRELDDDRVLVHCFAACDVESVLAAVGLTFDDLYPPRAIASGKPERRPFPAADVLRAIGFETLLVSIAAAALAKGEPLAEQDKNRLALAHTRISAAILETNHA